MLRALQERWAAADFEAQLDAQSAKRASLMRS
jgi:hypothetical protein